MRKIFISVVALLLLCSTNINANTFAESSSFHFYAGGFVNDYYHWTQYDVNADVTVTSCIKVRDYRTEQKSGRRKSKIVSFRPAGYYDYHTHSAR